MKATNMFLRRLCCALLLPLAAGVSYAAGVLTPVGSSDQPVRLLDHHVEVRITDGFARTTVEQVFANPNPHDVEALYAFPVPESASLSAISILSGETVLEGEVVSREEAERIYGEEKAAGNDVGMASKESYQRFEFRVFPVRPDTETQVTFTYYQPLSIDTGVGRYLYPIEEGGTDEQAEAFWTRNETVERSFSADVRIRSGYPLDGVRVKGFPGDPVRIDEHTWEWSFADPGGTLNRDLVVYYQLAEKLPGRVDLLTQRSDPSEPGYFLMTLTPGIDLGPVENGADYLFVLDTSGSMSGKIATLAAGMEKALAQLRPGDRAFVVTFSNDASDLTRDWVEISPSSAGDLISRVRGLTSGGGTNLYAGLERGLRRIDADRPTNLILVTDGVTNRGIVEPARFHELMKTVDLRFFGFLMGNSANQPLMRVLCEASDGFSDTVSNADDIVGKILLAKEKVAYESLLDAEVSINGVKVSEVTEDFAGRIFRGQQLSLFGRYASGGEATLELKTRQTGGDKTYRTTVRFPEIETGYPELERLWALSRIEEIELRRDIGLIPGEEAADGVRDLGLAYQLVTDETSMLVLDDAGFERHGIERRNRERVAEERRVQAARQTPVPGTSAPPPPRRPRADTGKSLFEGLAPRIGGGGAFGWESLLLVPALVMALCLGRGGRN